jgi:uncharacterized protein YjbI with pentapeptide repeats
MIHAELQEANLEKADYRDSHLNAANLYRANMSGMMLGSNHTDGFSAINLANLQEANMSGILMRNIAAEECNMKKANLTDADLTDAVLSGTIMRNANVRNANFEGVELVSVTMDFANFSEALNADIPGFKQNLR